MARGRRGIRAGGVRLGSRILRPAGVSVCRARSARMAAGAGVDRRHGALSDRRDHGGEPAEALSPFRPAGDHEGRRRSRSASVCSRGRWHRSRGSFLPRRCFSGDGWAAMGAAAINAVVVALVRAQAPGGALHGIQRREHRRHRVHSAVGDDDRVRGLSRRGGGDRLRDGGDDLDRRRSDVLEIAAADGIDARRRTLPGESRLGGTRQRLRLQSRCWAGSSGAIASS